MRMQIVPIQWILRRVAAEQNKIIPFDTYPLYVYRYTLQIKTPTKFSTPYLMYYRYPPWPAKDYLKQTLLAMCSVDG